MAGMPIPRAAALLVALALATACGDDEAPDAIAACGPGPHVTISGTLRSLAAQDDAVPGARLTIDRCPELAWIADDDGYLELQVTADVELTAQVEAEGYLPQRTTIERYEGDFDVGGYLVPSALAGLMPNWSDATPTMLVVVFLALDELPADAPEACRSQDGIEIAIEDRPEAVVTYFSGTTLPTADPSLTATTEVGLAEVSGLAATAPGESVRLLATKPGCDLVTVASYPHTDRITLVDGVLTGVPVRIPGLPWPSGQAP